jgi:hypothetical protein
MKQSDWPTTSDEAVNICLLTLTEREKQVLRNTLKENLVMFHLSLAKNIRAQFGLWEGNDELIKSCRATNPDDASMVIVKEVWRYVKNSD